MGYKQKKFSLDLEKKQIRPIEETIDLKLRDRGLLSSFRFFCKFSEEEIGNSGSCNNENHPHKLLYSVRAESAIIIYGVQICFF